MCVFCHSLCEYFVIAIVIAIFVLCEYFVMAADTLDVSMCVCTDALDISKT
jgi:hypothetical protein